MRLRSEEITGLHGQADSRSGGPQPTDAESARAKPLARRTERGDPMSYWLRHRRLMASGI